MSFLTARKRAAGSGAAGRGTEDHWWMTKSSAVLLVLIPIFVFTYGPILGMDYAQAVNRLESPFVALVGALTLVASMLHFKNGVQSTILDYTHGLTREGLIIAVTAFCYILIAAGLYALARIAL